MPLRAIDARKNNGKLEMLVQWALFEHEAKQNTWEAKEDLPDWFLNENMHIVKKANLSFK